MRVLVVEDDQALGDVIARGLRSAGMAIDTCPDGESALEVIETNRYDVVVLDRQLPGIHGDDVCRAILRLELSPRILMLTAAGALDDRVRGLEIGADDYLPKPFAMAELVARVGALARRPNAVTPPVIDIGDLRIDLARRTVRREIGRASCRARV